MAPITYAVLVDRKHMHGFRRFWNDGFHISCLVNPYWNSQFWIHRWQLSIRYVNMNVYLLFTHGCVFHDLDLRRRNSYIANIIVYEYYSFWDAPSHRRLQTYKIFIIEKDRNIGPSLLKTTDVYDLHYWIGQTYRTFIIEGYSHVRPSLLKRTSI